MKSLEALKLSATGIAVSALLLSTSPAAESAAREFHVYVGTYTGKKSKGIHTCRLDVASGNLSAPELAAETPNPTFLALHPRLPALYAAGRPVLYAANEVRDGLVSAFAIDRATGKLTPLNSQSARGNGPCHLSVDQTGKTLLVANYGGGNIAALPVKEDGSLGPATAFIQHTGSSVNKQRQSAPHAHWIDVAPDNNFAFVCDLGLDKIMTYKLDPAQGTLTAGDPPFAAVQPGAGPRHLAFHPGGKFAYVINELANTMTAFNYDATRGALKEIQTLSTLPEGATNRNSTAEVEVHPNGKFLYGSNRGHDSIVVYAIDAQTGRLTLVQHESTQGRVPRNFAIDPTGQWLLAANQDTDNVVLFRLDPGTGRLRPTGRSLSIGAPVCVKFVPVK